MSKWKERRLLVPQIRQHILSLAGEKIPHAERTIGRSYFEVIRKYPDYFRERLEKYIQRKGPNECWPWIGKSVLNEDYGCINIAGTLMASHRVIFELEKAPIPAKKLVRHICNNPRCNNPDHLTLGTINDNMQDKVRAGRQNRGDTSPMAKLTSGDVIKIKRRLKSGENPENIAPDFHMSIASIYAIRRGTSWAHIQ